MPFSTWTAAVWMTKAAEAGHGMAKTFMGYVKGRMRMLVDDIQQFKNDLGVGSLNAKK